MKKAIVVFVCMLMIATVFASSMVVTAGKGGGGGGGKPPKEEPPADPEIAYIAPSLKDKLMVMNADGSNEFEIYRTRYLGRPSWSPNGDAIAFTIGFYTRDLWRIDVSVVNGVPQGSDAYRLAQDIGYNAAWSPLCDEIAFVGKSNDGNWIHLQIIPVTGGTIETIYTSPIGYWVSDPTWKSDGSQLAFVEHNYNSGHKMIKILDLSDSSIRIVFESTIGGAPLHLDWAHTKDVLAYEKVTNGFLALYTLDITDENPTPQLLLTGNSDIRWPSWSPDDFKIAYEGHVTKKGNYIGVLTYEFSTEEVQVLAKGYKPSWSGA
jgi:Tol biopolymer transport system component